MQIQRFIISGVKIFSIFAVLFSGDLASITNLNKSSSVNFYQAHAGKKVDDPFAWNITVSDIDLVGQKTYDIFAFGEVYFSKNDVETKIEDKVSCIAIDNINGDDGLLQIGFTKEVTPSHEHEEWNINCIIRLQQTNPIAQEDNVFISFGEDNDSLSYKTYWKKLTLEPKEQQRFLSLLKSNVDKPVSFSFPVYSYEGADSIIVKFGTKNLKNALEKIK